MRVFLADEDLVLFVDGGEYEEGGHLAQDANGAHPTGKESGTKYYKFAIKNTILSFILFQIWSIFKPRAKASSIQSYFSNVWKLCAFKIKKRKITASLEIYFFFKKNGYNHSGIPFTRLRSPWTAPSRMRSRGSRAPGMTPSGPGGRGGWRGWRGRSGGRTRGRRSTCRHWWGCQSAHVGKLSRVRVFFIRDSRSWFCAGKQGRTN